MFELNDLLTRAEIDPAKVLVMRHRPHEPRLRRAFAWIAADRPDLFKAYQALQSRRLEKAMSRAKYVASLIGLTVGRALFVRLYEIGEARTMSNDDFWAAPENRELHSFGMAGWTEREARGSLFFDLRSIDSFEDFSGRLEVGWTGGERSWYRWANRNHFPLAAIHESTILERNMPNWDDLVLLWSELDALPAAWRLRLAEWRGIYLIVDHSDGRGYVGSAYGTDNILGRWMAYARTGHGGNHELRRRDANSFRFSILQRVSPDMDAEDVIKLENSWKIRLHTRELGLNKN